MSQITIARSGGFCFVIKHDALDNVKNNNGLLCEISWLVVFSKGIPTGVAKRNQVE